MKGRTGPDIVALLRSPRLPVVIVTADSIAAVPDRKQLLDHLRKYAADHNEDQATIIDLAAEEFWFLPEKSIIVPSFPHKRWTKQELIGLYNNRRKDYQAEYNPSSLSNRRVVEIVADIVERLTAV